MSHKIVDLLLPGLADIDYRTGVMLDIAIQPDSGDLYISGRTGTGSAKTERLFTKAELDANSYKHTFGPRVMNFAAKVKGT